MEWSCVLLVYPCLLPFLGRSGQEFHAKDSFSFDVTVMNQLWHPRGGRRWVWGTTMGTWWMISQQLLISSDVLNLDTFARAAIPHWLDWHWIYSWTPSLPPYHITPLISICKTNGMGECVFMFTECGKVNARRRRSVVIESYYWKWILIRT